MEISKNDKAKIKKAQLEIQKMKNKAAATESGAPRCSRNRRGHRRDNGRRP
jgi:hypothetical protein